MKLPSSSIRVIVSVTIIIMGLIGLALALLSGNLYREHSIKNHKVTIEKLISIKADQLLVDLTNKSRELGLSQQHETEFKVALKNKNIKLIETILDSHFHRYFVTAGILKLEKLIVLNREFSFLAESTEGDTDLVKFSLACPEVLKEASKSKGADRLKIKSGICENNGKTYHVVITPIGGLRLKGFMVVITDPVSNLLVMEKDFGMAMKFMYDNGPVIYKSKSWDEIKNNKEFLLTDFHVITSQGETNLHIETIENIVPLYNQLPPTRTIVLLSASTITIIVIILALFIIHKLALLPLSKITNQLSLIRNNKERLSDKIAVKGTSEIRQLAVGFNEMTSQLDELYEKMEEMAYMDHLTSLPNRHMFNETLHNIVSGLQTSEGGFALLMMDLNKFKPINDSLGHKAGDKVLQEVGERLSNVLRSNDSLLRIGDDVKGVEEGTFARLGGDEFAAIISHISSAETARVVAEKITHAMQAPFIIENHTLNVGISIGVALYPDDATSDSDLLHKADIAMYVSKNSSNNYTFF